MYGTCNEDKRLLSIAMDDNIINRLQEILHSLPDFNEALNYKYKQDKFFTKEVDDNEILIEEKGDFIFRLAMHKEFPCTRNPYLYIECWDKSEIKKNSICKWENCSGRARSYAHCSGISRCCFFYIGTALKNSCEEDYNKFRNLDLRKKLFRITMDIRRSYFKDYKKFFSPLLSLSQDAEDFCRLYDKVMSINPTRENYETLSKIYFSIHEEYEKCANLVMERWEKDQKTERKALKAKQENIQENELAPEQISLSSF